MGSHRASLATAGDLALRRLSDSWQSPGLSGILFVLKTGIAWEDLPREMGCGCGRTCFRRLVPWHEAGVWEQLHHLLLAKLHAADGIDWSRAIVDSASVKAVLGGPKPDPVRRIAANAAVSITC